ncbi:MAG: 2-hydroxyacyl-CoA dehydratase [Deltaproteobacteria bacterium]|nr:2-hydroxyacyl-CoA dehydratase [Deltaproteobacteria bacterium]
MGGYEPLDAMEAFRAVLADPDAVAREWKEGGGKVIGTRCVFVPEEIITAAGMLPYPLYGRPEPVRLADSYFQSCTCEFVRNIFDHALDGRFSFLDGFALSNTCDGLRRLWDVWRHYLEAPPVYMINNPQKLSSDMSRDYHVEELRRFVAWVEDVSGEKVTDERLDAAIDRHNRTRGLLRKLNALRREDPPLVTGTEALEASMAATILPDERACTLLEALVEEARGRQAPESFGARILVTGSILDDPALVRMIEEEGGIVVADDLCTSGKYSWHDVEKSDHPLDSLHDHFNGRPICACMHPMEERFSYVVEMADAFEADAVIDFNLKYCHPFMYEAPLLKEELESHDLPTTVLEIGHDMSGHGQLRTRIQAFLEMLD